MDKGEFIKHGYTVEPGDGGSWIVIQGSVKWKNDGMFSSMRGFSNHQDLLNWLAEEHRVDSQRDAAGHPLPEKMRKERWTITEADRPD